MRETIVSANGLDICVDVKGPDDGVPLLLVMGLGAQLISWSEEFADGLVDRGFRVIRHDNRDVGLSSKIDGVVDIVDIFTRQATGQPLDVPYTLSDMAADSAGVLDALEIDAAHVVGASMGGMIVQTMAIEQSHKVRSVTSIMSTTGDPDVGQATPEAGAHLLGAPVPTSEDEFVASSLKAAAIWGAIEELRDHAAVEARARREWQRGRDAMGIARQVAAIAASGSRSEALRSVQLPFTVIHGSVDKLVTKSGGERTAEVVPGAVYLELEGMGHDLPAPLWPQIFEAIVDTVRRGNA